MIHCIRNHFVENFRMTLKCFQRFPHDLDQRLFCRLLKNKTIAVGFCISVVLHGIFQSSHFTDNRHGLVTQTVDLIQSTGFIEGRHQIEVAPGFDQVGKTVIITLFEIKFFLS